MKHAGIWYLLLAFGLLMVWLSFQARVGDYETVFAPFLLGGLAVTLFSVYKLMGKK